MQVASYFASLNFQVSKKDLRMVDSHLKQMENKLKKFSQGLDKTLRIKFNLDKFDVDQKKLNLVLGNALDLASTRLVFQIDNFDINQARLNQQVATATARASRSARVNVNTNARGDGIAGESVRGRHVAAAGGIGGLAARMYTPALALGLGGYGLGAVNRRNQEVVSAQLMTQAVVQQAGGTQQQGVQSFNWLREQADRVGFNYLEAAPDFNKLLSGLTGAGMSVTQGQDIFQGFAELSRVNKLDKTSQNRLFRALSQVAGKDQLMSEELTGQIAEALPGGVSLFAEAYQRQIGGNLTGTDAIQALRKAMENRQVKGNVLISAAQLASEKAAPGLSAAQKASQAEQQRFQNALNNQAINASNSGVESGFARLFRSLAISMKEATPVVQSMAKAFDEISKGVSKFILLPQSIKRAFEGRDSWFGDTYGPETVENLKSFVEGMGQIFDEMKKIASTVTEGWSMLLPSLVAIANKIKDVFLYTLKMFNALLPGGEGVDAAANYGRAMQASMAGKSPEEVAAIAAGKDFVPNVKDPFGMAFSAASNYNRVDAIGGGNPLEILARRSQLSDFSEEYRLARQAEVKNKSSIYYNDPKGFDQMVADRMKAASFDSAYYSQKSSPSNSAVNVASGAIVINTAATDAQGIAAELEPHIKRIFDMSHQEKIGAALLMVGPQKE